MSSLMAEVDIAMPKRDHEVVRSSASGYEQTGDSSDALFRSPITGRNGSKTERRIKYELVVSLLSGRLTITSAM
jgi:hypothetical protein